MDQGEKKICLMLLHLLHWKRKVVSIVLWNTVSHSARSDVYCAFGQVRYVMHTENLHIGEMVQVIW